MARLSVERRVEAPPAVVFEVATDFASSPRFVRGIEKVELLTPGPVGQGTRFRETRIMMKREAVEEMEISHFDPPREYSLAAESHGARYLSTFRFEPEGPDGKTTRMTMSFQATPLTFFAKAMSVVMRPMMKAMADSCAKDLDDVKQEAERRARA